MRNPFSRARHMPWQIICVIICVLSLLATGCYDRQELEEQAFVITLGIDKAPGDMIDCTFRIALPRNPNAGAGTTGKTPLAGTGPITVRANTITEAMMLANTTVERTMSLTHLGLVIFSEDEAKSGLTKHLQTMVRYRQFRPTVLIAICKGDARGFIASDRPMLEQSPSRMADSIAIVGKRTGLIPIEYLHNFTTSVETKDEGVLLPLFAVNEAVKDDPKGKEAVSSTKVDYEAGQVSRSGGNPWEWMGAAIMQKDRLIGEMNGRDMINLRLLQGLLKDTKLDLHDPSGNGYITLALRKERKPTYHLTLSNPISAAIEIPLDTEVLTIQSGVDYTDPVQRRKLEESLSDRLSVELQGLLKRTMNKQHVDIIPLSDRLRRMFPTHASFETFPWKQRMSDMNFNVQVDLHIRRFGVQLTPIQSRG